jgi:hypothetical protein
MTPKQIMKMDPETRLALEARARVGDVDSVRDFVLWSGWRSILAQKGIMAKEKAKAFIELCRTISVVVEVSNG